MKGVDGHTYDGKWAVMLCGGPGSRMGSLTESLPKSLLLVHDKPIIWYAFWTLYHKGFRNFILPIGYLGHLIEEYILEISKGPLRPFFYIFLTKSSTTFFQVVSVLEKINFIGFISITIFFILYKLHHRCEN